MRAETGAFQLLADIPQSFWAAAPHTVRLSDVTVSERTALAQAPVATGRLAVVTQESLGQLRDRRLLRKRINQVLGAALGQSSVLKTPELP